MSTVQCFLPPSPEIHINLSLPDEASDTAIDFSRATMLPAGRKPHIPQACAVHITRGHRGGLREIQVISLSGRKSPKTFLYHSIIVFNMGGKYLILDQKSGAPDASLKTLEQTLKLLAVEQAKGQPIKIFELREDDPNPLIGFYLKSPNIKGIINHSFWVPEGKTYSNLKTCDGGSGTLAYSQAVSMIYRYLTHQPRIVVNMGRGNFFSFTSESHSDTVKQGFFQRLSMAYRFFKHQPTIEDINEEHLNTLFLDANYVDQAISSLDIVDIIEEDETVLPRIMRGLYPWLDFSFIVLDTETKGDLKSPVYEIGCTWDFYYGTRVWYENEAELLIDECSRFDKIATYNGEKFDFEKVLKKHDPEKVEDIIERKSIDLYKTIRDSWERPKAYRRRGELTLANVAFTTLGLCKSEVYHEPDIERRVLPIDEGIIDHCARDVELTKELFFFMLDNHHVYYTSHWGMRDGKMVDYITLEETFSNSLKIRDKRE